MLLVMDSMLINHCGKSGIFLVLSSSLSQVYTSSRYLGVSGQGSPNWVTETGIEQLFSPWHRELATLRLVGWIHLVDHAVSLLEPPHTELENLPKLALIILIRVPVWHDMDKEEPSQEKTVCLWWERTGERRNNTRAVLIIMHTGLEQGTGWRSDSNWWKTLLYYTGILFVVRMRSYILSRTIYL